MAPDLTAPTPEVSGLDPTVPGTGPAVPGPDPTRSGPDPTVPGTGPTRPGPDPTALLAAVCDPRIPAELRDLRGRMPGIESVLVASVDGAVLGHDPAGRDLHAAARIGLALLAQDSQATVALGRGRFRNTVIWGSDGYLAVYAAGPDALLLVQATQEARVGRLHVEARSSAATIAALLRPS